MCKSIKIFSDVENDLDVDLRLTALEIVNNRIEELTCEIGKPPTIQQLAAALGIHQQRCSRLVRFLGIRDQFRAHRLGAKRNTQSTPQSIE